MNRVRLVLSSLLVGAVASLALGACTATPVPAPAPAAQSAPVALAPAPAPAPVVPVAAAPTTKRKTTTATEATPTKKASPAKKKGKTAAECERIGNESSMSNAELYPYLRSIGCGRWLDAAIDDATAKSGPGAHSNGYDQNGDGVYNGYERCGTSCGEEPTSGETQYEYGCRQGYISGC